MTNLAVVANIIRPMAIFWGPKVYALAISPPNCLIELKEAVSMDPDSSKTSIKSISLLHCWAGQFQVVYSVKMVAAGSPAMEVKSTVLPLTKTALQIKLALST